MKYHEMAGATVAWQPVSVFGLALRRASLIAACLVGQACAEMPLAKVATSTGTGFVVSNQGQVVTAYHVVKDRQNVFIGRLPEKKWYRARVIKIDLRNDLALLEGPRIGRPLEIAEWSSVPVGLEVYAIGYPRPGLLGLSKKITQGIVNGDRGENAEEGVFQFSAEIQKGNSGGPVLAPDGSVVGVVQRKLDALKLAERSRDLPQNVNYALKSAPLIRFLHDAEVLYSPKRVDLSANPRPYEVFRRAEGAVVSIMANDAVDGSVPAPAVETVKQE